MQEKIITFLVLILLILGYNLYQRGKELKEALQLYSSVKKDYIKENNKKDFIIIQLVHSMIDLPLAIYKELERESYEVKSRQYAQIRVRSIEDGKSIRKVIKTELSYKVNEKIVSINNLKNIVSMSGNNFKIDKIYEAIKG